MFISQQDVLFSKVGWRALRKFLKLCLREDVCVQANDPSQRHQDTLTVSGMWLILNQCYVSRSHQLRKGFIYIGRCKGYSGLNVLTLTMDYLRVTYMCLLHVMDCFHSVDERSQNRRQL